MWHRLALIAVLVVGCSKTADRPPDASVGATTVVSLTFDDTRADQYQVGALVAARQMRATFYVNSSRIGRDGYMTVEQLRTLADAGNEIAGHTLAHVHLTELDSDAVQREICNDRSALLDLGFDVSTFAYPWGSQSAGVRRIAKECGYNAARDSAGLAIGNSCPGCPQVTPLTPDDPYLIKAVGNITPAVTLEQLEQAVLDAEAAGGGWVPIVFHHVCDGCASNAVSPATLTAFLDWLAPRRETGTAVKTVAEVVGGSVKAGVAGPVPGISANLILNAGLESDADENGQPDCWQQRGNGTNNATYTLTNGAYEGTVAEKIDITSYTDGTRRLLTLQECPLPAQAGHSYRLSAWYIATTPPRYSVYYQNTSGAWISLEQSDPLPMVSSYTQGVHMTKPLPADADAISVGLSINGAGSITMDAFGAVDAAAPTDAPPPTVTLTGIGGVVAPGSKVTLGANASDADGIARVDFRVNDQLEERAETAPFSAEWNTAGLRRGTYVITARAFDRSGRLATSTPISVTVGDQP